jgi:hypothetical protein
LFLSASLLFSTPAIAQNLPDAPTPKVAVKQPRFDKTVLKATGGLLLSEVYDGATTAHFVHVCSGCTEANPVSRVFIGSRPTIPRMVAFGSAEAVGLYFLANHMKHSDHKWERKTWWVPIAVNAAGHVLAGTHNLKY